MMIWQVARDLTRRLPEWEASAKLSLAIAIVLLLLLLAVGFAGPAAIQFPARIGAFLLLVTIQLLFLWGNRRDASPYHQAQQRFIAGDYAGARDLLETMPDRGRASVDALVLLGNSYRHLAQFDAAQAALRRRWQSSQITIWRSSAWESSISWGEICRGLRVYRARYQRRRA